MGSDLKAFRLTDFVHAITILENKEIASTIYEDGGGFVMPDLINEYWIGTAVQNKIIACYRLHAIGEICWESHGRILPEFRKKYGIKSTKLMLKWAAKNILNLHKIMGYVPTMYPNIQSHLEAVGFKLEGELSESYLRDGKICGRWIYGISKDDIEKF